MRKKIGSLLLSVFILFACCFVTACGNKYEDLTFKISYAFGENSSEWFDASEGILLNYITEEDKDKVGIAYNENQLLKFGSNSTATVYVKVEIENVKSKHLDKVTLSVNNSKGLNFTNVTVPYNQIVAIEVTGNVNTILSVYETNSQKSTSVDFNVYRTLTGIEVNTEVQPAVTIGNEINLALINNLTYLPISQTNQTGVNYEIESIGYFINEEYFEQYTKEVADDYLLLENNVLRFQTGAAAHVAKDPYTYAIKVKATSIHNPNFTQSFYVYIVDYNEKTMVPDVEFGENRKDVEKIVLADNGTNEYASTDIVLNKVGMSSIYKNEIATQNSTRPAIYKTEILIDDNIYDLENNSTGINGVIVVYKGTTDGNEVYSITLENCYKSTNKLKVRYYIDGLDFHASYGDYDNFYEKVIEIEKQLLPSHITINGINYDNNDSDSNIVYAVNSSSYKGLELTLNANPTNQTEVYFSITDSLGRVLSNNSNSNLIFKDVNDNAIRDLSKIANNSKIYVKFATGVSEDQTIFIKVRNNPTSFNGEEVAEVENVVVEYTLQKSVTASKIEMFVDEDCTIKAATDSTIIQETNLIVNAGAGSVSYVYAKVYFQGAINPETVKVTSSNSDICFNENKTEIDLNNLDVSPFDGGAIYAIPLYAKNADKQTTLYMEAANGFVGTTSSAVAISRKTLEFTEGDVGVEPYNAEEGKIKTLDEDLYKYAVAKGEFVEFKVDVNNKIEGIYNITVTPKQTLTNPIIVTTQETSSTTYSLVGNITLNENSYQEIDVQISYYGNENGYIEKLSKTVTSTIYVYDSIAMFSVANMQKPYIVYVNKYFTDAASTTFNYTSYTADIGTPTLNVEGLQANSIILDLSSIETSVGKDIEVEVTNNLGEFQQVTGKQVPITNLSGSIRVTLKNDSTISSDNIIRLELKAKRFETVGNVVKVIEIPIYQVQKAKNIQLEKTNVIQLSDVSREIQLSFLNVEDNGYAENEFYASLNYAKVLQENQVRFNKVNNDNMAYAIYEYSLDGDGEPILGEDNKPILTKKTNTRLDVNFNNGTVSVRAEKVLGGGLFKLVIATKESYTTNTTEYPYGFEVVSEIDVRVSDGTKAHKFIIYNKDDLNNINNNLNAHYVLATSNITFEGTPIGGGETESVPFTGSLTGKFVSGGITVYNSLNVKLNESATTNSYGDVYGLFAILGEKAEIKDLTINVVNFGELVDENGDEYYKFTGATNGLKIGAVAGVNKGLIYNVSVNYRHNGKLLITSNSDNSEVHFGMVVGLNETDAVVNLNNAIIKAENAINIQIGSTITYKIGMIAGKSSGKIAGKYLGKESLDEIVFDVVANLNITVANTDDRATIYAGAVAGEISDRTENVLVTGKIELTKTVVAQNPRAWVGGLVGLASGTIDTVAALGLDLTTSAALGLDLTTSTDANLGGIVGHSGGNITNAKFISAATSTEAGITYGRIKGKGVTVAGLVAYANSGEIYNSSVESFVNKDADKNTVYSLEGSTVYGLSSQGATLKNCFINAKVSCSSKFYVVGGASNGNTYFLGEVYGSGSIYVSNSTYAVYYKDTSWYINRSELDLDSYIENDNLKTKEWEDFVNGLASGANWELNETYNTIEYNTIEYGDVILYFPYLVDGGEPIMIERPTDIQVSVNTDFIVEAEGIYVTQFSLSDEGYADITETIIVNYYYATGKSVSQINEANTHALYNTYKLTGDVTENNYKNFYIKDGNVYKKVSSEEYNSSTNYYTINDFQEVTNANSENYSYYYVKNGNTYSKATEYSSLKTYYKMIQVKEGLIDLSIFPEGAQGGIKFELVGGYSNSRASIVNNNKIIFLARSEREPIIVKAYSVFNSDLVRYIAFYVDALANEIVLSASNVEHVGNIYTMSVYSGQETQSISIETNNFYNGTYYQSITENPNITGYLMYTRNITEGSDDVLDVQISATNISLFIKPNAEFEDGEIITVTFTLSLNSGYFAVGSYNGPDLELCNVNLLVKVCKAATHIEFTSDSLYKVPTSENVTLKATIETGFAEVEYSGNEFVTATTNGDGFKIKTSDNRDTIIVTFQDVSKNNTLRDYLNKYELNTIAELLNIRIKTSTNTKTVDGSDKIVGYSYDIFLELKPEVRHLTYDLELQVTITADSKKDIYDVCYLTFIPTNVSTLMVKNYAVTDITVKDNYQNLITNEDVETSVIDPDSKGSIMQIYIEPSYANVTEATLTTSTQSISYLNGKTVGLYFTQYVWNEYSRCYETLVSSDVEYIDNNKTLKLKTDYEGYNGVIYVHTQFTDSFSGNELNFTATLNVTTGNGETKTFVKNLTTSNLPGVHMYYEGFKENGDNLVQMGTYSNVAIVELFGYQFNSNPVPLIRWNLSGVNGYEYVDGPTGNRTIIKELSDNDINQNGIEDEYLIGDYVSTYLNSNYSDIQYDSQRQSYLMNIYFNVAENIPAPFELSVSLTLLNKHNEAITKSESLVFNPVDYILTDMYIDNINNNVKNLIIGTTTRLEFAFETKNNLKNETTSIYNRLLSELKIIEKDTDGHIINTNFNKLANLFYYEGNNSQKINLSTLDDAHTSFKVNAVNNEYLTVIGLSTFKNDINVKLNFAYERDENTGKYKLVFKSSEGPHYLDYKFNLNIITATSEENANPIYDADDLKNMQEGSYNILMNDIELESWAPLSVPIASLDGNNKIIKIKSFEVDISQTNYGLFATLGTYTDVNNNVHQSILKNVIVDYSNFNEGLVLTNNEITEVTFGGLVGTNNGGLIYNCDVINSVAGSDAIIGFGLDDSTDVNFVFGGLVGSNNNNEEFDAAITNSRVGRDKLTIITANANTESVRTKDNGKLEFIFGNTDNATNSFKITAGGLVGVNSGVISNSYVSNTSLTNYSTNEKTNRTAGFVGENNGEIYYSYVKAADTTSTINAYSTGSEITSMGNGSVAGFVYTNSGNINNAYANIVLRSKSAYVAGFVYENEENGVISESYAACTMNPEDSDFNYSNEDSYAEQPFVGLDNKGNLLSDGKMDNVYYLINKQETAFTDGNKPQAVGLNVDNFGDSNNLSNFVFVLSNTKTEREQGVWSYYDVNNRKQLLPVLIGADTISHSYKYLLTSSNDKNVYTNAPSYELGGKNNPYPISSVEEFNNAFTLYGAQYVRLINNIDFKSDNNAVGTRTYSLGDSGYNNITSIEGNGMTISGIYFDTTNSVVEKIGLFADIENSYIKNLNLDFATPSNNQFSTTGVNFSGGLAGTIKDSVIINVKLNGASTILAGNNFVGGLAGIITGKSLLYGVSSNLGVKVTNVNDNGLYYGYDYYSKYVNPGAQRGVYETYLTNLSYAGGIAGVIDLEERDTATADSKYNISFIDIYSNTAQENINGTTKDAADISASFVGGVAGYAGANTHSLKLKRHTGTSDLINGSAVAGGIYGVCLGSITASQVTADEDIQYTYDKTFADYILDLSVDELNTELTSDVEKTGNLNLIESYGYAGGLVGVGVGANIRSSYAKAGIKVGKTVGGLVGSMVTGSIAYSYAVPYINISNIVDKYSEDKTYIGGLIGSAYAINQTYVRNNEIEKYETIAKNVANTSATSIQFTFSTLLFNNEDLTTLKSNENKEKFVLDYLCADCGDATEKQSVLVSGSVSNLSYVFVGSISAYDLTINYDDRSRNKSMFDLYNLDNSEQIIVFNDIFSGWSAESYWSLNNEKFFPLLINENPINFIEIKEEGDWAKLRANHYGNYKIVTNNLVLSATSTESNWIFDFDFQGILIGELPGTAAKPVVRVQGLTPGNADSAGLFRQTTGATISNITFVWEKSIIPTAPKEGKDAPNLTMVAGLSCLDTDSLISNVDVFVTANDGYLLGTKDTTEEKTITGTEEETITGTEEKTITGFGGLLGDSTFTNVISCTFNGSINVKAGDSITIGGLVANASAPMGAYQQKEQEQENKTMAILSSNVGVANANVGDITLKPSVLSIDCGAAKESYIGAAVGKSNNTALSAIKVGVTSYNESNKGYSHINLNIKRSEKTDSNSTHIGGLVGYAEDSVTSSCDVLTQINDTSKDSTVNVGGLFGYYGVSAAGSTSGIKNVNVNTSINCGATASQTRVAAGAAETAGSVNIDQSLFTGEINAEGASTNVFVGGVVGYSYVASSAISLNEVMNTTDIKVDNASIQALQAGGLVGRVRSVVIKHSASAGRIDVRQCVENDGLTSYNNAIGGFAGYAENATINNSYTVTSLITSGLTNNLIDNLKSNALIGELINNSTNSELTNNTTIGESVFYSSDIALAPDDNRDDLGNAYGVNLAANILWQSDKWHADLTTDEDDSKNEVKIWKVAEKDPTSIPYIISLENSMKIFNVLNTEGVYNTGSSLKPEEISSSTTSFNTDEDDSKSDYTYYLLNNDLPQNITTELNGILVGASGNAYETSKIFTVTKGGTDYYGLIPVVSAGSAVSNIHLNLASGTTIEKYISISKDEKGEEKEELKDIEGQTGLIVGLNQGVVFNCSVNGSNLTINAEGASVGLIASKNQGLVSHSFATAEIVSVNCGIGGIVYTNSGKLSTNYFTGYINNTKTAAGIFVKGDDSDTGYSYNNYMAGVIEKIESGANSFNKDSDFTGFNNYIDNLANVETGKINAAELISTYQLMLNKKTADNTQLLSGKWITTIKETKINICGESYGFNFNYPVYDFNKFNITEDGELKNIDIQYQTYTGYGCDIATLKSAIESDNKIIESGAVDDILDLVSADDAASGKIETPQAYIDAVKIPHLGVLSSVQGLLDNNLNYVIIYDIDGKNTNWSAVGSNQSDSGKYGFTGFWSGKGFNGAIISNKHIDAYKNAGSSNPLVTITNLNKNGLFANIHNAKIGYLYLGNFYDLENSGAVGTNVTGTTGLDSIFFAKDSIIQSASDYYGALFGEIAGDVTLNFVCSTTTVKFDKSDTILQLSGDSNSKAGFVAGKLTSGSIVFGESDCDIRVKFLTNKYVGGIVGEMAGGIIDSKATKSTTINLYAGDESVLNYGGIVGLKSGQTITPTNAEEYDISNIVVMLNSEIYGANNFGGIVAEATSGLKANNIKICSNTAISLIEFSGAEETRYFGLVAGKQGYISTDKDGKTSNETVNIKVNSFIVDNSITNLAVNVTNGGTNNYDEATTNQGVGVLVGWQCGDLDVEFGAAIDTKGLTLKVSGVVNLGGVSGYYLAGSVKVDENFKNIILQGTANVGGMFGKYANAQDIDSNLFKDFAPNNTKFATIVVDGESDGLANNFGGLIGYLSGNINTDLTNHNKIIVFGYTPESEEFTTSEYTYYAKNIGGVVGKFNGKSASGLKNEADIITAAIDDKNNYISNLEADSTISVRTINVGGVFGLVESPLEKVTEGEPENPALVTISNCINENGINEKVKISGFQNVGGLVGKTIGKVTINGAISGSVALEGAYTASVTNNVVGVMNVGGAIGYATGNITITNIYSTASVYGNAGVGGLIGSAYNKIPDGGTDELMITNNIVGDLEKNETTVKGVYYEYLASKNVDTSQKETFIPTNIGGLVGYVYNVTLNSNIISNVNITSSAEGRLSTEPGAQGVAISTIKNAMVNNEQLSEDVCKLNETHTITFDNINSGYGGLTGSIDNQTMVKNDGNDIKSNHLYNIGINAQLGINVGTYYGHYAYDGTTITDDAGVVKPLVVPQISQLTVSTAEEGAESTKQPILIDGAYNVGGIVGFINSNQSISNVSNADLQGSAEIKLQSRNIGMYIGGLFGKLNSLDVTALNITNGNDVDVDIIIHTDRSYHMGGLVGLLQISGTNIFENNNVGEWVVDSTDTDSDKDTIELVCMPDTDTIISSDRTKEIDSAKNFGGLVGMVKSTKTGGDVDIMVKGKHRFAFTVNTILNSGYADGATQTSTKLAADSSSVTLLAQSYYINQDDFNISATSDETWYNADAKNPLNSQTIGWAKEYTGFRVVNRFIPAKDNGGEWDAHIPIYDAKDITAVGTVLNQNITTGSYMYEEKTDNPDDPVTLIGDEEDETGKAFADDPNKIIYTVYQREMSEAYLYCPIGIAKLAIFRDFDEDKQKLVTFGENGNIEKYEAYKAATQVNYVDVQKEVSKDKWEDRTKINFNLDGTGEKDHLKGKETVVLSNLKDLMFFNWEEHPLATFGHKEGDKQKYFIDLEKAYYYKIRGYYYDGTNETTDANGEVSPLEVYFDFQTIYANSTLTSDKGAKITYGNNPQIPKSGSVFEIAGFAPSFDTGTTTTSNNFWDIFVKVVIAVVVVVVGAVIIYFSGGAAAPALISLAAKVGVVLTVKTAVVLMVAGVVAIGMSLMSCLDNVFVISNTEIYLSEVYFSTKNQNLGLQSEAHTTQINYIDGKFVSENDIGSMVIGDNGQVYYYYSTIRPADYYTNYWFVMPTLNCTDENDIKKANSGEKPQDFIKPGGYDAIEKYFYKNGIYYYLPLASQTGWYQTQELSSKVVSDNNLELVTINGKKYFKGTFNGTDYEFVEKAGNKIKNVEVENGQITSATLNGYDFSDSLTVTQPEQFAYIGANVSVSGVKGYDYFDTVYLTLDGKPDESGSSAIATYTYRGDVGVNAPTGNIGYDYIVKDYQKSNQDDNGMYLYNEGIFISLTEEEVEKGKTQGGIEITAENRYSKDEKYTLTSAYFTLTNTSATEENTSALTTPTKDMTDKTISYTLYPGALINPYAVDANANNTKRTEKTYANISSSLFDGGVIPSVTIQEDITYFYYEGGYITDLDLGAGVDGKATKVYTLVCDSDKKYNGEDISTQKITLYKYDKDTKDNVNTSNINEQVTAEFVTISQLYAGLSGTYYIIDVSDPSYKSYLEETDDTKNPLAVYKVSNYYKTHTDGCLYKLDDMYFIGGDAMGGDYEGTTSGMVYKYYTYASAKTQDSFMYNKYLTNTNFKLYTAHVFTDLHGNKIDFSTPLTDSEGNKIWYFVIDGNNYHLLPDSDKFTGNPNTPTTYFAESCKVTLGGGLTLTHTGVGGSVESGTITIE